MMTFIVAGFVLACAITTLSLVIPVLFRSIRTETPISDLRLVGGPHSAGRSARAMAIPRKHPAIRSQHARSLK